MRNRAIDRGALALAVGIASIVTSVEPVMAHARLVKSEPAHQAVLKSAPQELRLTFNSLVERRFARFSLSDAKGKSRPVKYVPGKSGQVRELSVPLPPLSAGAHRLGWSVVSADGHRVEGAIAFTVR